VDEKVLIVADKTLVAIVFAHPKLLRIALIEAEPCEWHVLVELESCVSHPK
jgi:hypothetical protein